MLSGAKVLLHIAPMKKRATNKIQFFSNFWKQNFFFFFVSEFYMKNVFFWGTLCWCCSKTKKVGGGAIIVIVAYGGPSQSFNFWATSTLCTSKEHIFHVEFRYKKEKKNCFQKFEKNWILFLALFVISEICSKTLRCSRQA